MEELLKLLGLVKEDQKGEAQKLFDAVKTHISGLDTKINAEEKLKIDAIASRDDIKSKLKSISTGLGVDADNVIEAIDAIKNSKGKGNDEIKDKEINALKAEIVGLNTQIGEVTQKSSQELLSMSLKTAIAKALPKHNAKTAGYDYITSAIEKQASFTDGKLVFLNEDKTTLRINGNDATVDDMVKQMFEKEQKANESMFFNIKVQESGGHGAGGGNSGKGDFDPNAD